MKALSALLVFASLVITSAHAKDFRRAAISGRAAKMHDYKGWDPKTCGSKMGVVKVVNMPNNGILTTRNVPGQIGVGRYNGYAACKGTPITAFRVEYTSSPGFRGMDSFRIELTSGSGRHFVDTFTVNVR